MIECWKPYLLPDPDLEFFEGFFNIKSNQIKSNQSSRDRTFFNNSAYIATGIVLTSLAVYLFIYLFIFLYFVCLFIDCQFLAKQRCIYTV